MMNKKFIEIKRNVTKELPEFYYSGNIIILPPLNEILRAVYFELSGYDKSAFSVTAFVMPLCVPTAHLTFNFGTRVRHTGGGDRWTMSMPNLMKELCIALKDQALPFLAKADSLPAFANMAAAFSGNLHTPKAIAFALARAGQSSRAVTLIDELLTLVDPNIGWHGTIAKQAMALKIDLLERPSEAHRKLKEWEIETARSLGLERLLNRPGFVGGSNS